MKINQKILKAINEGIQNGLLSFDDVEFDQSTNIDQKVSKNIKDWKWIQDNFVDLGLPSGTLWAKHNLGATLEDNPGSWFGNYYAWGEVNTKNVFSKNTYTYTGNDKVLPLDHDAAYSVDNRMCIPTIDQFAELVKYTKYKYVTNYNGVNGLTGVILYSIKNEKDYIFIPFSGYQANMKYKEVCLEAILWSSAIVEDNTQMAYNLYMDVESCGIDDYSERWLGACIRPVVLKMKMR